VRDVGAEAMSRPRMKPIKPLGRDKTGVLIQVSAYDSMAANDAAWRALLRLPVGYSVKRLFDRWVVLGSSGVVMFEWSEPSVAIMEVVGYDE